MLLWNKLVVSVHISQINQKLMWSLCDGKIFQKMRPMRIVGYLLRHILHATHTSGAVAKYCLCAKARQKVFTHVNMDPGGFLCSSASACSVRDLSSMG